MLLLKLKLQYSGLMQRVDSLVKILMLGKTEGKRKKGQKRMRWLDSIIDSLDMSVSKHQEIVEDRGALCATVLKVARYRLLRVRQDLATEQQQQEQPICFSDSDVYSRTVGMTGLFLFYTMISILYYNIINILSYMKQNFLGREATSKSGHHLTQSKRDLST